MQKIKNMKISFFNKNKSEGFIKAVFIVIIALIIFSFFADFKSLASSKRLQDNYQYIKTLIVSFWNKIFKK